MRLFIFLFVLAALDAQQTDTFLNWMDAIAQRELQAREDAIARIHTIAEAEQRKKLVREKILQSMGGLPEYSGPLNAKVTGTIHADGYSIEKIVYESQPGFFVTADLYRPNQPGRHPAVLLQSGHTQEGKSEPQLLGANLALKGFVALAFDPIGQGEREQTYDSQIKAPLAGWSVPEHAQGEAQSNLIGQGLARYFIFDAQRSLDYLVSRPDVDANRLGAAGCSGGGALTTFIGALDPRLKIVIPACYPSSYRLLFSGENPGTEMGLPQFLAQGLDVADFVELTAPTPWLIQATEHDYFTPAGVKLVYEEARRWYKLYGAEDRVGFFVGPGPHGTPLVSRQAVYQWLIRWLKDGQGDYHELPAKLYTNQELLATPTGHVDDLPGSRKLYQLLLDELKAKRHPGTTAELSAKLRELKIPTDHSAPRVTVVNESGIRFESEPGIELDAKLYVPSAPGRKQAVILLSGKLPDLLAERIAKTGRVVLNLEPRHAVDHPTRAPYVGNYMADERADEIGRNLPAMRAHDILRAVNLLVARPDVDPQSIRGMAQGVRGIWLLLAAAADPRIGGIWLDRTPYSMAEALHNTLNVELADAVIPGFVLHWDLQDLVKVMGNRPVLWTDPTNWMARLATVKGPYRYRWVLGDLTDRADEQDDHFLQTLFR